MSDRFIELFNKQKAYFKTYETIDINFRIQSLIKLQSAIKKYEKEIINALYQDLGKSEYESYMCEVGLVYSEITYMLRNIRKFTRNHTVNTPLAHFASHSYTKASPYGNTLVMSPWNYPFLLTLDPVVDAIAAGNTVIVKPSAYSPYTSEIIKKLIDETFDEKYIAVVLGGRKENAALLDLKFDMIFFTGSEFVGKEVLRHAAENLIPCVLELGGKSPCIVEKTANIPLAAKRIIFGKFINSGQTCVAPDYILCDTSIKEKLIEELIKQIKIQYGDNAVDNPNFGKIINEKHYDRLLGLINQEKVVFGGNGDRSKLKINPTILDNVTLDDAVMQEEIFGPILPIMTYDNFDEVYDFVNDKKKPLALYLYSEDKQIIKLVSERIQFGGGCINDCIIQVATSEMGFGGVGESGMGSYHGCEGFKAFSHTKSIIDKKTWLDLPMRYQPYQEKYRKILKMFLK